MSNKTASQQAGPEPKIKPGDTIYIGDECSKSCGGKLKSVRKKLKNNDCSNSSWLLKRCDKCGKVYMGYNAYNSKGFLLNNYNFRAFKPIDKININNGNVIEIIKPDTPILIGKNCKCKYSNVPEYRLQTCIKIVGKDNKRLYFKASKCKNCSTIIIPKVEYAQFKNQLPNYRTNTVVTMRGLKQGYDIYKEGMELERGSTICISDECDGCNTTLKNGSVRLRENNGKLKSWSLKYCSKCNRLFMGSDVYNKEGFTLNFYNFRILPGCKEININNGNPIYEVEEKESIIVGERCICTSRRMPETVEPVDISIKAIDGQQLYFKAERCKECGRIIINPAIYKQFKVRLITYKMYLIPAEPLISQSTKKQRAKERCKECGRIIINPAIYKQFKVRLITYKMYLIPAEPLISQSTKKQRAKNAKTSKLKSAPIDDSKLSVTYSALRMPDRKIRKDENIYLLSRHNNRCRGELFTFRGTFEADDKKNIVSKIYFCRECRKLLIEKEKYLDIQPELNKYNFIDTDEKEIAATKGVNQANRSVKTSTYISPQEFITRTNVNNCVTNHDFSHITAEVKIYTKRREVETVKIPAIYCKTPQEFITRTNVNNCVTNHDFSHITAEVKIYTKRREVETVKIPAIYCKTCNKYYILENEYQQLLKQGKPLCSIVEKTYWSKGSNVDTSMRLRSESLMHTLGYTVNAQDNLSEGQRRDILNMIIEEEIMSKGQILTHLKYLIDMHKNRANMTNAVNKWSKDREYVSRYVSSDRKVEVGKIIKKNYIRS